MITGKREKKLREKTEILKYLKSKGLEGANTNEISEVLEMTVYAAWKRLDSLKADNLVYAEQRIYYSIETKAGALYIGNLKKPNVVVYRE